MSRIMKTLPFLFCLFVPCSPAMDEAAVVRVKSVSFNYIDLTQNNRTGEPILKGTTLAFAIAASENGGVEIPGRIMFADPVSEKGVNVYPRDGKGSSLGQLKHVGHDLLSHRRVLSSVEDKYKEIYYYATFSNLPAIGSEKLDLSGEVPAHVFSCKTISPPRPLQIKNGSQLFLDGLTLTVAVRDGGREAGEFEAEFQFYSPDRAMKILDINFFDRDGKPLADDNGNPAFSYNGGGRTISMGSTSEEDAYLFKQKPGLLNVSVRYWAKVEELELPVPPEVLFYDPGREEHGGKQK